MKNIFFGLLLSLSLISCGPKETYEQQITQYNLLVSEARTFYSKGFYEEALSSATDAIKITDTLAPALLENGYANLALNKWKDARNNFSDAIDIEGERSIGFRGRAISNYFSNEKSDFIDDINTYIKHNSRDEYAHSLRADYFVEKREYKNAIKDYTICLSLAPNNSDYYLKRGNTYAMLLDNLASIADYENYTRLNPDKNHDQIFYKRAKLNTEVNKYQKSIDDLMLMSSYQKRPDALRLMADNYVSIKNYEYAIANYTSYLAFRPKDVEVYKKRGSAFIGNNNLKSANQDFTKAALLEWTEKCLMYKYGWWTIFVFSYLIFGMILFNSVKQRYDGKKIRKGYFYYIFLGIFGGHHAYTNGVGKFLLLATCIFTFTFLNSFNFRSYYDHYDLLWAGITASNTSLYLLYAIITLLVLDFIILPYNVFSENHNLRLAIDGTLAQERKAELIIITQNIRTHHNNLKKLNS